MGGLLDIKIHREPVTLSDGQTFDVRAVSTDDLMTLVASNGPTLGVIFGKVMDARSDGGAPVTADEMQNILFTLAREFPEITGSVIALAADSYSDEGIQQARNLPFPTQLEAVQTIFRLTFTSEAEVKKFVESLTRMLVGVSGTLANLNRTSQTGIGA